MTVMKYVRWRIPQKVSSPPRDGLLASAFFHTLAGVFSKILPHANPDFDSRLAEVSEWWIETDDAGVPLREIAFDANGLAIFGLPFGTNYGYLTDSNMNFSDLANESAIEAAFEDQWQTANRQSSQAQQPRS
ncbi:MAG: hypothetical protein KA260_14430 [Burkholderiales bacterium]|nr:hypothetical protein [Burkholderiales bacterium]